MTSRQTLLAPLALGLVVAACGGGGGDSPETAGFTFRTDAPDRYSRVDRTGQPAIATALLSRDPAIVPLGPTGAPLNPGSGANPFNNQRDALNRGNPVNDARDFAGLFTVGPQSNTLSNIHFEVAPQLRSLGLTLCSFEKVVPPASKADVDISACVAQVAPVVLPDVMTYDPRVAPGWPNGRGFDDPVVDRLLAAALLMISGPNPPHTINAIYGVLNAPRDESNTVLPPVFPHLRDRVL